MSEGWDNLFKGALQCVLPRSVFDHFPTLLDEGGMRRGSRFKNTWLEEGFNDLLKNLCVGLNVNGSYSFVLVAKLRALKVVLKSWNKDVFDFIEAKKEVALNQVAFWDDKERVTTLSLEEVEAINEAREEYKKWVLREEILWQQKSKEVW